MNVEQQFRLLLVEDEPTQRLLLNRRLTRAGYLVETAKDGDEALAKILQGQIQILITDWDMPGMDGVTLCRRVREANLTGYLYILLLTSHGSISDIVAGLDAGADDFLEKPADEAELLARLKAGRRIVEFERSLRDAHAQLQAPTITDPLLGIYNRRHLMDELPNDAEPHIARVGSGRTEMSWRLIGSAVAGLHRGRSKR
jgi:two-component system cell cycle response regulator